MLYNVVFSVVQLSSVQSLSRVRLLATPWTAAYQAPPSMGFSKQEYWSGVPSPSLFSSAYIAYSETNKIIKYKKLLICEQQKQ